ncbi:ATP-binding protein [Actinocrispum sp. NPDC049592]|uniref:ATP-binding protein n=1 Tax=Actinocrispum sp. NPDC049592 TaxID=3154835 RepID=UPI003433BF26
MGTSSSHRSLHDVLSRLALTEARVRAAVQSRRGGDTAADPFRGLYLSDSEVDRLLTGPAGARSGGAEFDELQARIERDATEAEEGGETLRLRDLVRAFGLTALDVELLFAAMAPEVDSRFERLYGYLHDDMTRRRASVGLALELAGIAAPAAAGRARLCAGAPLIDGGLVEILDTDRPFLTRALRVPDRVTMHLLGDDTPDPSLDGLTVRPVPCLAGDPVALGATLKRGATLCYLREHRGSAANSLAAAAFTELGLPALVLDLGRLRDHDPAKVAAVARREARLMGAGLVAGPVDAFGDNAGKAVPALCDPGWPVILHGRRSWDPKWTVDIPLSLEAPMISPTDMAGLWDALLTGDVEPGLDVGATMSSLNLDPAQVQRATSAAWWQAAHSARPIGAADLRLGARTQNAAGLERLARRTEPAAGWPDLVLPSAQIQMLRELVARARLRGRVLDDWKMRNSGRGTGIAALFTGAPGTGKTLTAEVLAYDLGFDLYTVDIATVVDKYIGETEKNLERIFTEAEQVNGVLFFDEADALFGKRSEVQGAHDRYANVETAFLLQRMEKFDGLVILATNLSANLDDAFTRRLDAVIDFPRPDAEHRYRIWDHALNPAVPRADDVDLRLLAERFELAGGNIRNITLAAGYFAADENRAVSMVDLMRGVHREFVKLGKLCKVADFEPYEAVLT